MSHHAPAARRRVAIGVALALLAAAVAAPAAAQTVEQAPRTYTASAAPTTVCAAPGQQVAVTLRNTSTTQLLGSADVRLAKAFALQSVTSVTVQPAGSTTPTAQLVRGGSNVAVDTIQLRNLSAAPLATVTVTFTASPAVGTYTVGTQAKQANNFNGPPGNDLQLVGVEPSITAEPCELDWELRFTTQPGTAEVLAPIPGPPTVSIVDGQGVPVAAGGVSITMTLLPPVTGGAFTTNSTVTTSTNSAGVATFGNLRVDRAGQGFRLNAAADFDDVDSATFDVFDDLCLEATICTTSSGNLRDSTLQLTASASGLAGGGGGGLNVAVEPAVAAYPCDPPPDGTQITPLPSQIDLFGENLTEKTVQIRVAKAYDQIESQKGAAHYQVCAQPLEPKTQYSEFRDRYTGQLVTIGQWGYLPDCDAARTTVCIVSRTKNQGDPVITVFWGSRMQFR